MNQYWSRDGGGRTTTPVRAGAGMAPTATTAPTAAFAASRLGRGDAARLRAGVRAAGALRRPRICRRCLPTRAPARRRRRKGGPAKSARVERRAICPARWPRTCRPGSRSRKIRLPKTARRLRRSRARRPRRPAHRTSTAKPAARPVTPAEHRRSRAARADQAQAAGAAARGGSRRPGHIVRQRRHRQHRAEDHQPPAAEQTSSGSRHGLQADDAVRGEGAGAGTRQSCRGQAQDRAGRDRQTEHHVQRQTRTVSEAAPGHSTFTALSRRRRRRRRWSALPGWWRSRSACSPGRGTASS